MASEPELRQISVFFFFMQKEQELCVENALGERDSFRAKLLLLF
jgi:hypothetical protein